MEQIKVTVHNAYNLVRADDITLKKLVFLKNSRGGERREQKSCISLH
jgi:hypothetical protein